ncbi:MAG: hypothetical protein BVN32_09020 [Proteobacteria bacterium ST_bin14]|nr:MAG: hypothetical protein BVN32_09020 [Proteobacteria bacterium ST_bin14]
MAAVQAETGVIDVSARRPVSSVRQGFTRFGTGDVIFAKITPCMENGKIAVIPAIPAGSGFGSTEFHVMSPRDVTSRYLYHWVSQRGFRETAEFNMTGTAGQKRVPTDFMRNALIPVPSVDVQNTVVARIDELFAEIDDGEAALARARDDLATWRKALLKAAVTGELTADWRAANPANETGAAFLARILGDRRARWDADARNNGKRYKEPLAPTMDGLPAIPEGWTWASFDQLVDQLSNGISAKPAHSPPGIPILRISSVRPMLVRDDQRRWLPQDFPVGGALTKRGDLLFTRYNGNPELVGVCGRYRGDTPIAYPDKVMCAPPSSADDAVGDFLELAMNAGASRKHIAAYTKTSAGQHGVAGSSVKVAPVPIPPQAELEHIVQVYRDATAQAEDGWSDAIELNAISSALRQSILAAAFRGELA